MNLNELPLRISFTGHEKVLLEKTVDWTNEIFQRELGRGPLQMGGHGRDHWNRVAYMAGNIAVLEEQNPFLSVLAGLSHDVGRVIQDGRAHNKLHGKLSAETIADFIDGLKLAREQKDITIAAIEDHPFLNHEVRESEVVKVLMDADRIDGMGANMIVRASAFLWQNPSYADLRCGIVPEDQPGTLFNSIKWVNEWYDMLWTNTARRLAAPRLKFMELFSEQYLLEAQFADECAQRLGF